MLKKKDNIVRLEFKDKRYILILLNRLLPRHETLADIKHILLVKLLCDKRYRGLVDVMNHDFIGLLSGTCPKRRRTSLSHASAVPTIDCLIHKRRTLITY